MLTLSTVFLGNAATVSSVSGSISLLRSRSTSKSYNALRHLLPRLWQNASVLFPHNVDILIFDIDWCRWWHQKYLRLDMEACCYSGRAWLVDTGRIGQIAMRANGYSLVRIADLVILLLHPFKRHVFIERRHCLGCN